MAFLEKLYQKNLSLLTDMYQLTMGMGYWRQQMHAREAVFHLYYRKPPFGGDYVVAAGLEMTIEYLKNFKLSVSDAQYLMSMKAGDGSQLFDETYVNMLQRLTFECDVDAVPEGTIVYPNEPILRIKGPLLQAQLFETALLNFINFSSLIATKAQLICQAAEGDPVYDFGLRRAQGPDGGLSATRAAYIGGCKGTSNVLAGKLFGIPVSGTHAHSWVMAFEDEQEAFDKYAEALPNNVILLVDTYDTFKGVEKAIKTAKLLESKGKRLLGIRLDSGDLASLSKAARKQLDDAGLEQVNIIASNDLDDHRIRALKKQGAKIDVWGVGTRLVTAYDQPALGGVYKLGAIRNEANDWLPKMKFSNQPAKASNPGILQVARFAEKDVIYDERFPEDLAEAKGTFTNLLQPIFRKGKLVYHPPKLSSIRDKVLGEKGHLPEGKNHSVEIAQRVREERNRLEDQAKIKSSFSKA